MAEYKPYDDDDMVYDQEYHRYILTPEFVETKLNRDLSSVLNEDSAAIDESAEAGIFLDRVSQQIYDFCMTNTPFPFRRERDMALRSEWRLPIKRAMTEQLVYILNNGDISNELGINIDTGMTLDHREMRRAEIAPRAYDILAMSGMFNLAFRMGDRDIKPKYTEESY